MGKKDRLTAAPTRDVKKECVARRARGGFNRGATFFCEGADIGRANFNVEVVLFGYLPNESGIRRRGTSVGFRMTLWRSISRLPPGVSETTAPSGTVLFETGAIGDTGYELFSSSIGQK